MKEPNGSSEGTLKNNQGLSNETLRALNEKGGGIRREPGKGKRFGKDSGEGANREESRIGSTNYKAGHKGRFEEKVTKRGERSLSRQREEGAGGGDFLRNCVRGPRS